MGRESSHGTKELFNLPPLVLKARHLAKPVALPFAGLGLPEQAMRWMVDFGRDHLPYVVLAVFMFITFNLVPFLLLCLYPCRCFQSCLNCCRLNSQVLRTFMDAFQGCYKFEPYDCRCWATFYMFLRIAALVIFAVTHFIVVEGILLSLLLSFIPSLGHIVKLCTM